MRKFQFTLIELLVVIAIIAILAGITMPAINSARESSYTANCASNLKQIGSAVMLYAASWDGYMIPYNNENKEPWSYILHRDKFLSGKMLYCPSSVKMTTWVSSYGYQYGGARDIIRKPLDRKDPYRLISYGINYRYLAGNDKDPEKEPEKFKTYTLSRVISPTTKIMASDACGVNNEKYKGTYQVSETATSKGARIFDCHKGAAQILWCDGHVSAVKDAVNNVADGGGSKNTSKYFKATERYVEKKK